MRRGGFHEKMQGQSLRGEFLSHEKSGYPGWLSYIGDEILPS